MTTFAKALEIVRVIELKRRDHPLVVLRADKPIDCNDARKDFLAREILVVQYEHHVVLESVGQIDEPPPRSDVVL